MKKETTNFLQSINFGWSITLKAVCPVFQSFISSVIKQRRWQQANAADIHSTNKLFYLDQEETTTITDLHTPVCLSAHPPSYPSHFSGSIWPSWTKGQGNLTLLLHCKTGEEEGSGPGRWRSILWGLSAFLWGCVLGWRYRRDDRKQNTASA